MFEIVDIIIETMCIWTIIGGTIWIALYVLSSDNCRKFMRKYEDDETLDYIYYYFNNVASLKDLMWQITVLPAVTAYAAKECLKEKLVKTN